MNRQPLLSALRYHLTLFFVVLACLLAGRVTAQAGNPFELTERLGGEATGVDSVADTAATGNPFDVARGARAATAERAPANRARGNGVSGPLIIQPTDPGEGRGSVLAIHLVLLLGLAGLWLLFGNVLSQCVRAAFNDGLANQLYTRRSGGVMSALWVSYVFFFLAAGFYLYLLARYYNLSLDLGAWGSWGTYALVVAAAVGLKSTVLNVYAKLFPVQKEISRYLFVMMIFSIIGALLITPVNLLASYAPENFRWTFLHGGIVVLAAVYLLHLLRGVFIANRLVASRPVHILLYICAVEIAPILLIYRYLSDTLA